MFTTAESNRRTGLERRANERRDQLAREGLAESARINAARARARRADDRRKAESDRRTDEGITKWQVEYRAARAARGLR